MFVDSGVPRGPGSVNRCILPAARSGAGMRAGERSTTEHALGVEPCHAPARSSGGAGCRGSAALLVRARRLPLRYLSMTLLACTAYWCGKAAGAEVSQIPNLQTNRGPEGGACFPTIEALRFVKVAGSVPPPPANDVPLGQKSTLIPETSPRSDLSRLIPNALQVSVTQAAADSYKAGLASQQAGRLAEAQVHSLISPIHPRRPPSVSYKPRLRLAHSKSC